MNLGVDLYKRFKDDINLIADTIQKGTLYSEKEKDLYYQNSTFGEIFQEFKGKSFSEIYSLRNENSEKDTMKILNEIADSIHPMIKFTSDVPSNHQDGLLPVLDLKVKLTKENMIHYEFYEKVTKNPKVLLASSAFPWHSKRNIMVNEALRRLRNTAAELGPALQNQHLNQFMLKLKDSGYSEAFRVSVVKQAKQIYAKQLEQDRLGVKPLFRSRDQILKDKKAKSESGQKWWSRGGQNCNTVLFVPPTPGGKLASALRERVNQLCSNAKIKIKVLETGGTKVKNLISK